MQIGQVFDRAAEGLLPACVNRLQLRVAMR